jgi:hypothetical protein
MLLVLLLAVLIMPVFVHASNDALPSAQAVAEGYEKALPTIENGCIVLSKSARYIRQCGNQHVRWHKSKFGKELSSDEKVAEQNFLNAVQRCVEDCDIYALGAWLERNYPFLWIKMILEAKDKKCGESIYPLGVKYSFRDLPLMNLLEFAIDGLCYMDRKITSAQLLQYLLTRPDVPIIRDEYAQLLGGFKFSNQQKPLVDSFLKKRRMDSIKNFLFSYRTLTAAGIVCLVSLAGLVYVLWPQEAEDKTASGADGSSGDPEDESNISSSTEENHTPVAEKI